jgi:hypothetical protein
MLALVLHLGGVGECVRLIWGWSDHGQESGDLHSCLGILVLESCRGHIKIICGIGIKKLGSKVTTAMTAPLQAMPPEVHQKEWKNISMG